jgi:hypothetical protein
MITVLNNAPDLAKEDYCVLGLATCFVKQEGEIFTIKVIEPIPYPGLEALIKGSSTSYSMVIAKSLGEIFGGDNLEKIAEFPRESQFCSNFTERTITATRTYKNNTQAQSLLPLGTIKKDFNLSLEKKRILNADHFVLKDSRPY